MKIEMNTKKEWEAYLTKFFKAYNELPGLKPGLKPIAPLVFQYVISDKPEMNFWELFEKTEVKWGMGKYSGPNVPKTIHKTDFETIKKVVSGESDPVQATIAGSYTIEGDFTKLTACSALLPLNPKAHAIAIK